MQLITVSSIFRRLSKTSLLIAALLFTATCLQAQESMYLKNHWSNEYIGGEGGKVIMSPAPKKTLWFIERVDDMYVRLKNKEGLYLNVEKGYLEASNVSAVFFSGHWKLPAASGYNYIVNRWTGVYIHNQNGKLEASAANTGWWSTQWAMEDKDGKPLAAKDFSLNAYTSLLPNQQMYYKLENLKYDPTPIFLDINKTKSSELTTVADYGGDNSGKAWKFTLITDGWYKISNLKLGGNKVLAIAKNADGTYYFVLTDFANYPNQLWRMIQFKDQTLLNYVTEKKLNPEKFGSIYYTLLSKQHGLEAITAMADIGDNMRFSGYGLVADLYNWNPFDLFWRVQPVEDIAAIKNIPLSLAEQNAFIKENVDNSVKIFNDAMLKATPIAESPFKQPVGRIKGEPLSGGAVSGRDLSALIGTYQTEYTQEQWNFAMEIAGKIPMFIYNNTNFETRINISYTDQWGQPVSRNYVPIGPGKVRHFYLDPMCTYISFTGTDTNSGREVYKSTKFYRSKGVKIYLDGNVNDVKESIWNY